MKNSRNTLTRELYNTIKAEIISLKLEPNSDINEAELAKKYSVSRTPLRETLSRLCQEGLVNLSYKSGAKITPIIVKDLQAALFARRNIEVAIISEAAKVEGGELELLKINQELEIQEFAIKNHDYELYTQADTNMHSLYCDLVGRSEVWNVIEKIKTPITRFRYLYKQEKDYVKFYQEHKLILEAVKNQDIKTAATTMEKHTRLAVDLASVMKKYPSYFE